MVDYNFEWIDGCRVEVNVAAAFRNMAAAFLRDTGCELHVRDGSRTREEQQIEWDKYVARGYARPKVAEPGTSNHEIDGPNGPRSLDLYDSCGDPGVTVFGTARDGWMQANAESFGFQNEGNNFDEPWHKTFRGTIGGDASGGGGGSATAFPARESYGEDWTKSGQDKLQRMGYNIGASGADGYDGPETQAAVKLLQARGGLDPDGVYGPATNELADRLLGVVNGHRAFPLPAGYYFGPQDGPVESVSGFHSYRDDLLVWQDQMRKRGWTLEVDGLYGQGTHDVAYAFQEEKGLTPDGLIGPDTWNLAWEAPVTPPDGGTDPEPPVETVPGHNATDRPLKDIQKYLGVKQTGNWDKTTSNAVLDFQKRAHVDEDYIWGITCDGLAFPPAGARLFGVDYSFSRPDPGMLAERNIKFAGRYLWKTVYEDGRTNKGIGLAEYNALLAKGIAPFFFYEEDSTDPIQGFAEGVRQARAAEGHRIREGLPALPIYFPVDYDAPDSAIPAIIEGLRGAATVVGIDRVGVYAKYSVVQAAFNSGVIKFACQTYAWSKEQWDPRAQLRQWSNGQYGDSVDFQYAMAAEFGQTPVDAKPVDPEPNKDKETLGDIATTLGLMQEKLNEIAGRM